MPTTASASSRRIGRMVTVMGLSLTGAGMRRVIDGEKLRRVNLGVALGGGEGGMPQQLLDRAQVTAAGQQVRGERMAQGMRRSGFRQAELHAEFLHRQLHETRAEPLAFGTEEERAFGLAGDRQR